MSSLRRDLSRLRSTASELLHAPSLSPADDRALAALVRSTAYTQTLLDIKTEARPRPLFTTMSDSGFFTYAGVALGVRQILLRMAAEGKPLPPTFNEAPPKILCTMAPGLNALAAFPIDVGHSRRHLPKAVRVLIDLWEDSGLGMWAESAVLLSHVPLPGQSRWVPLTPEIELK